MCGVDGKEEKNVMVGYKRSICQMANTERMHGTKNIVENDVRSDVHSIDTVRLLAV